MAIQSLGIIAGNGEFPLLLARCARDKGIQRLVAAAFEGETDPTITSVVQETEWIRIGQLDKLINVFTSRNISQAVMAGAIAPDNLFRNLRLDLRMMSVAARLRTRNAETIFGAVAEEMLRDGVQLLDPREFLGESVPQAGLLTRQKPTKQQQRDIELGLRIAKTISSLDIGQTVVVKEGTVLAVEALEGSDECIRRGGALSGENGAAVVVKVSKPNHDFRFDIPCIGHRTIESCADANIAVLAVEAGKTLLLDREKILQQAGAQQLCVVAVETHD